jgi:hypothetical protein
MWVTVLVAIVVALSGWATTGVALYAQARRDDTAYERSQREAKIQRVRSAYRLALKGADILARSAWEAASPLAPGETLDKRAGRLDRDYNAGADMLGQALIDLILEDVSNNIGELTGDITHGHGVLRLKIAEARPDGSPVLFEELHLLAAPLVQSTQQLRQAIRAHMAELEQPPKRHGLSWPSLRRPRADAPDAGDGG